MTVRGGQLDTTAQIVTPENIAFEYRLAGPFTRLGAWVMDFLIRLVVIFFAGLFLIGATSLFSGAGLGLGLTFVLWFLLDWFYAGLFEAFWNGQTPGKRILRLRVLSIDGQPINGWQAILRNLLRGVDGLPALGMPSYLLGLGAAATTQRFQRLGDLAAGTMVVMEDRNTADELREAVPAQAVPPDAQTLAETLPASLLIERRVARALAAYMHRRGRFSPGRRERLAAHLAVPLSGTLGLPMPDSSDLFLCALFYREFLAETVKAKESRAASGTAPLPPERRRLAGANA